MLTFMLALSAWCPAAPPPGGALAPASRRASGALLMAGKGFGPPKPPPKPKVVKKSAAAVQRDQAASDFDKLKESGSPEYMVMVRTVPESGEPSKWYPVGGIAVPRSSSEDVALSMAIFQNEEALLKGLYRAFPFLKKSTERFEYGYRLKEFEDDPVKIASKEKSETSDNPVMNWCPGPPRIESAGLARAAPAALLRPAHRAFGYRSPQVQQPRQPAERRQRLGQPAEAGLSSAHGGARGAGGKQQAHMCGMVRAH